MLFQKYQKCIKFNKIILLLLINWTHFFLTCDDFMLCTFGTVYSLLKSWSFLQEALEESEKDYSFYMYLIIIDAIERIPYQYKIEISID